MGFNERESSRERKSVVASLVSDNRSKGRPKSDRETKKRVSIVVLPSLYEDIKRIAFVDRKSVSEIISSLLKEYISNNSDKLDEYERIEK